MPDRNEALRLLEAWVENEGLRKHMLAVEASVRHYAKLRGGDPDVWGLAGLLHDLDWEKHPDRHPLVAVEHLRSLGYPEEVLHAILAHRSEFTGVEPTSELDKVLVACDELSGLVFAACLVRPNGVDDQRHERATVGGILAIGDGDGTERPERLAHRRVVTLLPRTPKPIDLLGLEPRVVRTRDCRFPTVVGEAVHPHDGELS